MINKASLVKGMVGGLLLTLTITGTSIAADLLPRISKVCESTTGEITAIRDGYSTLKRCPANSRLAYIIGEKGEKGDPGIAGPQGQTGPQGPQGEPGTNLDISKIYTKIDGPFDAPANSGSTVVHGCYQGDLVLGGGLYEYTGKFSNWLTISSIPYPTEPSNIDVTISEWQTTVINTVENGRFFTLTRCLDLI
jgi:hypothetical protein